MSPAPRATVVITTKDRSDDLRRALRSALAQDVPLELLVIDDGSSDGAAEMVRHDFAEVRLVRCEQSRGYVVQRNLAAQLATTPYIVSIDDDAEFSSPGVIAQTLADFNDDRIGAVAIPFINVQQDNILRQRAPATDAVYVTDAYIGTAHAVRRELFLELCGYRSFLVHQGEEMDYCIRMLAAGYVVRLGRADPIYHSESPRRDFRRMDFYGRRNDVLFGWHNVPFPEMLAHLTVNLVNGLRSAARARRFRHMAWGTATGIGHALSHPRNRRPVSREIYWLYRRLRERCAVPLADIESLLAEAHRKVASTFPKTESCTASDNVQR